MTIEWKSVSAIAAVAAVLVGIGMWAGDSAGPAKLNRQAITVNANAIAVNANAIADNRKQRKDDAKVAREARDALIELTVSVKHMTRAFERSSRSRER